MLLLMRSCFGSCLATTSLSTLEAALRSTLPRCSSLPPAFCAELLMEEGISDGDSLLLPQHDAIALPQRPYVRDLARALMIWRDRGAFPWAGAPSPADIVEMVPREGTYEPLTRLARRAVTTPTTSRLHDLIERLGPWGILALLRCRRTVGSEMRVPPSPRFLVGAFCAPHSVSSRLSVGARALTKHWRRNPHFWGAAPTGNDDEKNARALRLVHKLMCEAAWVNLHSGVGDGVYEIRVVDGFGARWSADGASFRGFLEPQAWDVQRRSCQSSHAAASPAPAPIDDAVSDGASDGTCKLAAAGPSPPFAASMEEEVASDQGGTVAHDLARRLRLESALTRDSEAAGGTFLTVAGYASLMDEESARETSASARAFRHGHVEGYCRVFNLVSIINIRRGLASGRRLATATARPRDGYSLRVCLYEIALGELPALARREARLQLTSVPYTGDDGRRGHALLCTESSDAAFLSEGCGGDANVYEREVGQHYRGALYRTDLLPVPSYVMRCLRAQRKAGASAVANFLDASFMGDGETTLRSYLEQEILAHLEEQDLAIGPSSVDVETASDDQTLLSDRAGAAGRSNPSASSENVFPVSITSDCNWPIRELSELLQSADDTAEPLTK